MSADTTSILYKIGQAIKALTNRVSNLESSGGTGGTGVIDGGTAVIVQGAFTELDGGDADL